MSIDILVLQIKHRGNWLLKRRVDYKIRLVNRQFNENPKSFGIGFSDSIIH